MSVVGPAQEPALALVPSWLAVVGVPAAAADIVVVVVAAAKVEEREFWQELPLQGWIVLSR